MYIGLHPSPSLALLYLERLQKCSDHILGPGSRFGGITVFEFPHLQQSTAHSRSHRINYCSF